eukprot:7389082-Prymnesium_polylepis.1
MSMCGFLERLTIVGFCVFVFGSLRRGRDSCSALAVSRGRAAHRSARLSATPTGQCSRKTKIGSCSRTVLREGKKVQN